ncbi:MAG: hypothetical protein WKF86_08150 [Acidimicrobiales bacterium]
MTDDVFSTTFGRRLPTGRRTSSGRGSGYLEVGEPYVTLLTGVVRSEVDRKRLDDVVEARIAKFLWFYSIVLVFTDGTEWSFSPAKATRIRMLARLQGLGVKIAEAT